ncbi:MAG: glycosyltransferase family 39 protein, partial [Chloroflexota bacterium]
FSFCLDEALSPSRAESSIIDILRNIIYVQDEPTIDTHPQFYFLLIHFSQRLIGQSDFAYRYPSVLFFVLSIPLMAHATKRLFNHWLAGWIAAGLWAINPLNIWYGQEARMYTLLNLLGVILIIILWRAIRHVRSSNDQIERNLWRWFIVYAAVALFAGLTHVTAAFFVAGHGIIWAYLLWRYTKLGRWFVLGGATAGLAISPFLPRLVPRLFSGAEKSFGGITLPTILNDLIRGYGMGFTPAENYWLTYSLWWGFVIVLAAVFGILASQKRWHLTALLAISLLSPALLIAAVSLLKPMYTGIRHIMIGSPAFVILLAAAVFWGVQAIFSRSTDPPINKSFAVPLGLFSLAVTLIAAVSSINTLWNNPKVAKDNVRELVGYIEDRAGSNDLVIYNDAILMLSHEHYMQRDDLPVTAIPIFPYVATGGTIDNLNRFQQEYERIWFVPSSPNDGRDETFMVHSWLLENTLLVDAQSYDGKATVVRVEAYQTQFTDFVADSQNQIALEQVELADIGPGRIWINTFWDSDLHQLPEDAEVILELEGADGWIWVRHQQRIFNKLNQIHNGPLYQIQLDFPRPVGLNAGDYELRIELVTDDSFPAVRQKEGSFSVVLPAFSSDEIVSDQPAIQFENGVSLKTVELFDNEIRPGHFLPSHVVWETNQNISTVPLIYKLQVYGPDGDLVIDKSGNPAVDWIDT